MSSKNEQKAEDIPIEGPYDLEKIVKISLIIGIIVISGFILYYLLNPEPGFVTFGILNSEKKAENYPTEVSVNEDVEFYIVVENHLNTEFVFEIRIYKGDNETKLSSDGSENADLNYTTDQEILDVGEKWESDKLSIRFSKIGSSQILIAELWEITEDDSSSFYDIIYLRLNITA